MDYGKFKYQEQKKAAEARKKQKTFDVKEAKVLFLSSKSTDLDDRDSISAIEIPAAPPPIITHS